MVHTDTYTYSRAQPNDESWLVSTARKHWATILVAALVGALLGALFGYFRPPVYTAETRYAVGSGEMSSASIPGFPAASSAMAQNYSRWVTVQGVGGLRLPEGTLTVSASPLPESNVLRVEATSLDPAVATQAAAAAGSALMAAVNEVAAGNDPAKLLEEIKQNQPEVDRAQLRADQTRQEHLAAVSGRASAEQIQQAKDAYVEASTHHAVLLTQQNARNARYSRLVTNRSTEATLVAVTEGAYLSGNTHVSSMQRFALIGMGAAGLLVGLLMGVRDRGRAKRSARAPDPDTP